MHERFGAAMVLATVALCVGCAHAMVPGPALPDPSQVVAVEVSEKDGSRRAIRDTESVRRITRSVSYREWEEVRPGVPTGSRFELVNRDGSRRTYWIGGNG